METHMLDIEYVIKRCNQGDQINNLQTKFMISALAQMLKFIALNRNENRLIKETETHDVGQQFSQSTKNQEIKGNQRINQNLEHLTKTIHESACRFEQLQVDFQKRMLVLEQKMTQNNVYLLEQINRSIKETQKSQQQNFKLFEQAQTYRIQNFMQNNNLDLNNLQPQQKSAETCKQQAQNNQNQQAQQAIFNVGTGQKYQTMADALQQILKLFGQSGNKIGKQQFATIMVCSDLVISPNQATRPNKNRIISHDSKDLSWITLKSRTGLIRFIGNLVAGGGNLWYFDQAFTFAEGLKFDVTNLYCTTNFSVLTANKIILKNIEINSGDNKSIDYNLYITGGKLSKVRLESCRFIGARFSILMNVGQIDIIDSKINKWGQSALYVGKGVANIEYSNLSQIGVSSQNDLLINPHSIVNQVSSKCKSKLSPNTNNQSGVYFVTGSQDTYENR